MLIKRVRPWILPEKAANLEAVYLNRRTILKQMGFLGLGLSPPGCFLSVDGKASPPNQTTLVFPIAPPPSVWSI